MIYLTDENYIGLICNGELDNVPNITIGELFESFFDNINYNVVKKDGDVFVDFTGEAMCDNKPCNIIIRFIVNYSMEDFKIVEVKVDEDMLNEEEILDLLEDIAYVGGATMEGDCCDCDSGDCSHCSQIKFDEEDIYNDFNEEDENNEEEEDDEDNINDEE